MPVVWGITVALAVTPDLTAMRALSLLQWVVFGPLLCPALIPFLWRAARPLRTYAGMLVLLTLLAVFFWNGLPARGCCVRRRDSHRRVFAVFLVERGQRGTVELIGAAARAEALFNVLRCRRYGTRSRKDTFEPYAQACGFQFGEPSTIIAGPTRWCPPPPCEPRRSGCEI